MPMSGDIQTTCLQQVRQTVDQHDLIHPGDRILIAVSGGRDSVALLHLLNQLAAEADLFLAVAHLNHGLRGSAADRDEQFVSRLAEDLTIPCHTKRMPLNIIAESSPQHTSMEQRARQARYDFFKSLCRQNRYNKLATGHHQQDNAEWILLNLIRGCGLAGICGIPYQRPLIKGSTQVIRPLMDLMPDQLAGFLQARRQIHMEDHTNHDRRILRNRIRLDLLPHLAGHYNARIVNALHRLSRIAKNETRLVDRVTQDYWEQGVTRLEKCIIIDLKRWPQTPAAIRDRLIRRALAWVTEDGHRFSYRHVKSVADLSVAENHGASLDLPARVRVTRVSAGLQLVRHDTDLRSTPLRKSSCSAKFRIEIAAPGYWVAPQASLALSLTRVKKPDIRLVRDAGQHVAFFDMDRLRFPLILRNIEAGDRFQPLGMRGTKKVARYLMDRKVAYADRTRVAVLLSGETIIWVLGHQTGQQARLCEITKQVLKVEMVAIGLA